MKKIVTARLHLFRSGEHYEFMVIFRNLADKFPVVQALVAAFREALDGLIDREGRLINVMHKSNSTEPIVETARHIDRILTGMRRTVTAALRHFDPVTVEDARILYNRIAAFGNISKKAYMEKITDVRLLIDDLLSDEYAAKAAAAGLSPWLAELQSTEAAFEQLLNLRNIETAQKPHERLVDVRRETDAVYRHMVGLVTAAAALDGAAGTYDEFIAQLNVAIARLNSHTRPHRRDLGAGGACTVDTVAPQAATGRPLTPLPAARYREEGHPDVELIFARDYAVTYRNNVRPGMADLVLHGRGAYRGRKTVTFTITGELE
ncbi:MAG: DUF6261 family protein [Tannerella sp.]|jgi:hypothetical protein|nr:DUF6261 family protein [Tannerella sp.]